MGRRMPEPFDIGHLRALIQGFSFVRHCI
jgi:hypothetical protein